MLNQMSLISGVLCCLLGAVLLFGAISKSETWLVVGAAVVSLGVFLVVSSLRDWLKWKQYKRTQSEGGGELVNKLPELQRAGLPAFKLASEADSQKGRRSQRVMLQIAVFIKAEVEAGKPVRTHAFTAAVNAHGGLLESPLRMTVGQKMTLVNPQSRNEVGCRVVKVQKSSSEGFTTAFEFEERSPWFWPIASPPLDWAAKQEPT
jgi:hypothetical protein